MSAHHTPYHQIIRVLLPKPFKEAFDYGVPENLSPQLGQYVLVPFGRQNIWGIVWEMDVTSSLKPSQIKPIQELSSLPPLSQETRDFLDWTATYTLSPLGSVSKMLLSVPEAIKAPTQTFYQLSGKQDFPMTPAREKIVQALKETVLLTKNALLEKAHVSSAVVSGLLKAGGIKTIVKEETPSPKEPITFQPCTLNPAQQEAGDLFRQAVQYSTFKPFVLEGVTGSGKTEVYFEGIKEAIDQGKQSLILVPEISLSIQWVERFKKRFGIAPTLWHSDIPLSQKKKTWRAIAEVTAQVIVGARSALFLPYKNLGYIVVDEEHDHSYKQETSVIYQARDLAIMRGYKNHCPVILSSATPSLETLHNVDLGKYQHLHLPERHGASTLPKVAILDTKLSKKTKKAQWISEALQEEIKKTLEKKEQVLLFLNRRGYSPLIICHACGHHMECPNCSVWLVYHKKGNSLQCHHCHYKQVFPKTCPECGEEDTLRPCGPGVERVAEEVDLLYPDARTLIMTSDTLASPKTVEAHIQQIQNQEVDIIIGTQVMAKGHHFPTLTLVGVVDGDLGLGGGDLRAAETTYQLLHQVGGRAGRADLEGRVFIQTHNPDHPVMQALKAHNHKAFLALETEGRKLLNLPPFGKLASLIVSGKDPQKTEQFVQHLATLAPHHPEVEVLGPSPAPLHQLHRWYRWRFLIKTKKTISPQKFLTLWLEKTDTPSSMKIQVDIDPYSFF